MLILHIIPSFSGEFHFFIHDHLGNTRVVVNESGDVVESYDYYPFGMNLRRTLSQPIGTIDTFTGKELDEEGELDWYYFGARYYDARIGRWMGVDPMADEYPGLSPYAYCANSPVNLVDPNGMEVVGDSTSAKAGADEINEMLKVKNIENASADITPVQRPKPLFQRIMASLKGESTTTTMRQIVLKGEGWNELNANDPSLSNWENALASKSLSMLKDIIESKETWTIHYTDDYKGTSLSEDWGGGINSGGHVYWSPLGNLRKTRPNYEEPSTGIFMHELVGHSHPHCYNATWMNYLFNNSWTRSSGISITGSQTRPHNGIRDEYSNWWKK